MSTRDIIQRYLDGLNKKEGWESLISEQMTFNGPGTRSKGKAAYVEAMKALLRAVKSAQVNRLIIEADSACVISHYELVSPKGSRAGFDIAEIFVIKDEKIESSSVYFHIAAFRIFLAEG